MNFEYNTGEHGNNLKSSTQNDGNYEEESYKSKNDNIAFIDVISDMISTGHADGHQPDNLLMEIKGYKFAQNKVCLLSLSYRTMYINLIVFFSILFHFISFYFIFFAFIFFHIISEFCGLHQRVRSTRTYDSY